MPTAPAPLQTRPPRIVVCSGAVGCGHTKAGLAILEAIRAMTPSTADTAAVQVGFVEALDHAPKWFVTGYRDAYLGAIAKVPRVQGWLYRVSDRPSRGSSVGESIEARALQRFLNLPEIQAADLIVTTHFLCARVLSRAIERGQLRAKLVVCVTDQHPHGVWLTQHADALLVASDIARDTAIREGTPPERVITTGIPISAAFAVRGDKLVARTENDLPTDRPIALVAGGGLGLGGIERVVAQVMRSGARIHLVAVCGRNAALKTTLDQLASKPGSASCPSCTVLGYTTKMAELMSAADVYVGKPGGLSTAEAAAMGLPMIMLDPIPGQEEFNAELLSKAGAAVLCREPTHAAQEIIALLADEPRLSQMRSAAAALGRPRAAVDAAREALRAINIDAIECEPARVQAGKQLCRELSHVPCVSG